jgi:hypothetical protein
MIDVRCLRSQGIRFLARASRALVEALPARCGAQNLDFAHRVGATVAGYAGAPAAITDASVDTAFFGEQEPRLGLAAFLGILVPSISLTALLGVLILSPRLGADGPALLGFVVLGLTASLGCASPFFRLRHLHSWRISHETPMSSKFVVA